MKQTNKRTNSLFTYIWIYIVYILQIWQKLSRILELSTFQGTNAKMKTRILRRKEEDQGAIFKSIVRIKYLMNLILLIDETK